MSISSITGGGGQTVWHAGPGMHDASNDPIHALNEQALRMIGDAGRYVVHQAQVLVHEAVVAIDASTHGALSGAGFTPPAPSQPAYESLAFAGSPRAAPADTPLPDAPALTPDGPTEATAGEMVVCLVAGGVLYKGIKSLSGSSTGELGILAKLLPVGISAGVGFYCLGILAETAEQQRY